jgi:hypothetical protein
MTSRDKQTPEPLELMFMLADGCMPQVSPRAWKIVAYVARRVVAGYATKFRADHTALGLLAEDLATAGCNTRLVDKGTQDGLPHLEIVRAQQAPFDSFAAISLAEG